eukprot:CAMPEP_0184482534 /NCGR_PEP_ID=MMETSP0113_2-20130426/4094_1 /TAXON_ID=91329 /ORGANISM="Norrisiella sphaerica, Strain BC52" /LENGTH=117 /DNA_ID=CAMNT_0026862319 /DNA_START=631 /DNA_END=981 /DNA_ORIENTATION=-
MKMVSTLRVSLLATTKSVAGSSYSPSTWRLGDTAYAKTTEVTKITKRRDRADVNLRASSFLRQQRGAMMAAINIVIRNSRLVTSPRAPIALRASGNRSPMTMRYDVATPKHFTATAT